MSLVLYKISEWAGHQLFTLRGLVRVPLMTNINVEKYDKVKLLLAKMQVLSQFNTRLFFQRPTGCLLT